MRVLRSIKGNLFFWSFGLGLFSLSCSDSTSRGKLDSVGSEEEGFNATIAHNPGNDLILLPCVNTEDQGFVCPVNPAQSCELVEVFSQSGESEGSVMACVVDNRTLPATESELICPFTWYYTPKGLICLNPYEDCRWVYYSSDLYCVNDYMPTPADEFAKSCHWIKVGPMTVCENSHPCYSYPTAATVETVPGASPQPQSTGAPICY
jgi:hypothetical protein